MNAYEQWAATPGIPGEPLENVALTLKFEAMGAQVLCMRYVVPGVWHMVCGMRHQYVVEVRVVWYLMQRYMVCGMIRLVENNGVCASD